MLHNLTLTPMEYQTIQNILKSVNPIKHLPPEEEIRKSYSCDEQMLANLYNKFEL